MCNCIDCENTEEHATEHAKFIESFKQQIANEQKENVGSNI